MQNSSAAIQLAAKPSQRNDVLKLLALLTMLVDHIGYLFFPHEMLFRTIGRIAFPIFAFQLAEGFRHTSNRSAYAGRLALFAVISAVPYAFFNPELQFDPLTMNIMVLLLMGFGAMALWEKGIALWQHRKTATDSLWAAVILFAWLLWMVAPRLLTLTVTGVSVPFVDGLFDLKLSYAGYGLWMMMLFYWFGKKPLALVLGYIALSFAGPMTDGLVAYAQAYMPPDQASVAGVLRYILENFKDSSNGVLTLQGGIATLNGFFFQSRSLLALAIILLLKDRTFAFKMPKAVAYWFYPVHMTVLMIVLKFFWV